MAEPSAMPAERVRVLVIGAAGRMGRSVVEAVGAAPDLELAATVDPRDDLIAELRRSRAQVAVDFTTPQAVRTHLLALLEERVHPVIGTTGLPAELIAEARERSRRMRLGGVIAPNFALGAVLMIELARQAARYLPAAEIVEYHHAQKLDSPSGTSLRTRTALEEALPGRPPVPIHSVRLPGFLAHQEVILGGEGERLSIRHDTLDRKCYMPGVLLAIRRVRDLREIAVGLEHLLDLGKEVR